MLASRGARALPWRSQLQSLDPALVQQFQRLISDRWNERLDQCHGARVLRRAHLTQLVGNSLHHFDGDRYDLADFVIMPNHVHKLAAFPGEDAMLAQCDSWKHFTAIQINRLLGRQGRFWQQDGVDHLVRSLEQFEYFRRYIADNPQCAHLRPGEYIHYSKRMQSSRSAS